MKKMLAALAAVFTLATAGAAAAQDWRQVDHDRGEWRGDHDDHDWRGRDDHWRDDDWRSDRGWRGGVIVVRDLRGRIYTFDRRDYEWDTLSRGPFGFRPGFFYVYTDDCRRRECQVHVYDRHRRRLLGHLWAPLLGDPRYFNAGYGYRRGGYHDDARDEFRRRLEEIIR